MPRTSTVYKETSPEKRRGTGRIDNLFFATNYRKDLQIDCLDGIRGLAILLVLFGHLIAAKLSLIEGLDSTVAGTGQLGVYLFFVLSAFLLTRALIKKDQASLRNKKTWLEYFFRRFFRIYPLYTVALLSFVFVYPPKFSESFSIGEALKHFLLFKGQGYLWTIPMEVKYYFLLPLFVAGFVFVFKRNHLKTFAFFMALAVLIQIVAFASGSKLLLPIIDATILTHLPIFLMGSLLAVVQDRFEEKYWAFSQKSTTRKLFSRLSLASFSLLFLLMPNLFKLVFGSVGITSYPFFSVFFSTFWGLLCSACIFFTLNSSGFMNKLFCLKLMRFMGVISFSVYIWHPSVLKFLAGVSWNTYTQFAVFWVATLVIGSVSFLLFEKPFARLRLYC
jgi:peptidoglycan/LPS O-acetylase OafA/YrhL